MSREVSERAAIKTPLSPFAGLARTVAANGILLAFTVVLYLTQLQAGGSSAGGDRWQLIPLVMLGACASALHSVTLQNTRVSLCITLSEIPAIVAIAFLRPAEAVPAFALGLLAACIIRKRALLKAMLATTAAALAMEIAILAYRAEMAGARPDTLRGWAGIFVAISIILAVDNVLVLASMRFIDPLWRQPPLKPVMLQFVACAAVCTAGGLVAISLIEVSTWGAILFAGIVWAVNLGYRAAVTSAQRYANLEKLYDFTRRLSSLTEARDVMLTVLEEARALLSTSTAEVVIPLAAPLDGVVLRCILRDDEPPVFEEGAPLPAIGKMVGEQGAVWLARGSEDPAIKKALKQHGVREALVAPLQRDDHSAGYLLVADRPYKHEGFSKSDLLFFETLTANAGVALRSSELMEQLRREVAIRQHQAHHDRLTGLPNRAFFNERLQAALDASGDAGEQGDKVAVLLVDLDSFKDINDTLGHHTGDAVLREIARRITPFAKGKDLVARLGGDEFALLLGNAGTDTEVHTIAEEFLTVLTRPMAVDDLLLDSRASLGVAVAPAKGRGRDAINLVRHADIAMYTAKEAGGGVRYYDPTDDRSTLRRLTLATELRRALEKDQLDLYYQPVVHLGTGEVLGCEALLRWDHEQFGPVSPVEFIPVAENAGLIDPITWWVLERALAQVKAWHELIPGLTVSVNLSARSLTSRRVPDRVVAALSKVGLEARSLTLELTESSMMADPAVSQQAMFDLKDIGVKLSIDDYGTGFSSLSRLKDLPFRELKIDRSFVKEMINDRGDEAIVRSTIELARNLGRTVTAEGVEDKATLHRLAAFGCTAAQGYYLARPLPAAECSTWLRSFVRWPSTTGLGGAPDLSAAAECEANASRDVNDRAHRGTSDDRGTTAWQLNS